MQENNNQQQQEQPKLILDEQTNEMVSKAEYKRRQKARQKAQEKAQKQQNKPETAQNDDNEPQSQARLYRQQRIQEIQQLEKDNIVKTMFPYKLHLTCKISQLRKYDTEQLQPGQILTDTIESVLGRIKVVRKLSSAISFVVIEQEDSEVQIILNKKQCQQQLDEYNALIQKGEQLKERVYEPNEYTLSIENIKNSSNYPALQGIPSDYSQVISHLKRGDMVVVTGNPMRSNTKEFSINPLDIVPTAYCIQNLPKVAKITDIETRYTNRSMDMFYNKTADIIRARCQIISKIRELFESYGFLEVETPILHPVKGGANATPFITYYEDLKQNVFLRIAPELYLKQLTIGGIQRVFELNRNFRNESIDQTHLPEFTMLESYCVGWDLYDQTIFVENVISEVVKFVNTQIKKQTENLYIVDYTDWNGNTYHIDFKPPFKRIDIMSTLEEKIQSFIPGFKWLEDYSSQEFNEQLKEIIFKKLLEAKAYSKDDLPSAPYTTSRLIDFLVGQFLEHMTHNPIFLMHHPKIMSPLAKPKRDNPQLTERFEVFCAMFELCNAYTELNDPMIQRENFEQQMKDKNAGDAEAQDIDENFLVAMEYGMPQQSGLGMGIDRLVMILLNQKSIREIIAFPMLRKEKK